jgi:hypothetical protein
MAHSVLGVTATTPSGSHREWPRVLFVQVALLPLYLFYGLVGAWASPSSSAAGSFVLMVFMWALVGLFLVQWAKEGRQAVIARAVAWACLAWLTVFLLLLLPLKATRTLLVPPPVE